MQWERQILWKLQKDTGKFTGEAGEQADMLEGTATFQMYFYRLKKFIGWQEPCEVQRQM